MFFVNDTNSMHLYIDDKPELNTISGVGMVEGFMLKATVPSISFETY